MPTHRFNLGRPTARTPRAERPRPFSGLLLIALRHHHGMTEKALGALLDGLREETVNRWETGVRAPEGPTRRLLAHTFNFPDLVKWDATPVPVEQESAKLAELREAVAAYYATQPKRKRGVSL